MQRRKFILQACHLLSGWRAFLLPTGPPAQPRWPAWWTLEAQKTLRSCAFLLSLTRNRSGCCPARLLWLHFSMTECNLSSMTECFLRFAQKHDGMLVDFCMAECRQFCYNKHRRERGDIMPISEKKKITNSRYIAKCDSIQIRPPKERGDEIRAAAAAAGQSMQSYILQAIRERMARDGFTPAESGEEGDNRG